MTNPVGDVGANLRIRGLIIPREHGAWGLLLIPLSTGMAAGLGSAGHIGPALLFTLCALSLFWLRTPLEGLLGSASINARTDRERQTALLACFILGVVAVVCGGALLWRHGNWKLLFLGTIAASAFVGQTVLRKLGRSTRMAAQLVGAIALTVTAPAAYYVETGRLDLHALVLWIANLLFAWNQIHFVQVRLHAARAVAFGEKLDRGKTFLLAQVLLLVVLTSASRLQCVPSFVTFAFLPALVRGAAWFVMNGAESLDVKKLGWSEMKQGVAFGVMLSIAFLYG